MLVVEIILASSSPRRRALLEELGVPVTIRPADIDETPRDAEEPTPYVTRLACEKVEAIDARPDQLVIAADTIVVVDGAILGKPDDDHQAASFLELLSGRAHEVLTGVAVGHRENISAIVERSVVHFAAISADDIDWYVATGETADKAGAYAIQGRGGVFVTRVEGSYDNVIGLPRAALRTLARDRGVDLLRGRLYE